MTVATPIKAEETVERLRDRLNGIEISTRDLELYRTDIFYESTYLPLADLLAAERSTGTHATPIFMAHGSADPIVPIARGLASRDALVAAGHTVEWHDYPMPHSVCTEEVADIAAFLKRVLA